MRSNADHILHVIYVFLDLIHDELAFLWCLCTALTTTHLGMNEHSILTVRWMDGDFEVSSDATIFLANHLDFVGDVKLLQEEVLQCSKVSPVA